MVFTGKGIYYVCRYYSNVIDLINLYVEDTYQVGVTIEDIETIYMIPYCFTNLQVEPSVIDQSEGWIIYLGGIFGQMGNPNQITKTITKPTSVDGYTPINKKLLTKEFNYLIVSNQNGATEDLAYELFNSTNCEFNISGIPVIRW